MGIPLNFAAGSVKWLNHSHRVSCWLGMNWGTAQVWKQSASPGEKEQAAQRASRSEAFTLLFGRAWSLNHSVRFIPVQTLGYPSGLVLRNICPQWWMGSRYQWECWKGLSNALWRSEAPGWEMRPCPTGSCRSLGEGIASLGRELSRWDLGCSPVCCCKSCSTELLQSWRQE